MGRGQRAHPAGRRAPRSRRSSSSSTTRAAGDAPHARLEALRNACRPTTAPISTGSSTACKAPDGSYWALQSWQIALPDLGFMPWLVQAERAGGFSCRTGPARSPSSTPTPTGSTAATSRRSSGSFTYHGQGVHGFGTTDFGARPTATAAYVYLDTYNSVYGTGWRRENAFVTHKPTGNLLLRLLPSEPVRAAMSTRRGRRASAGRARRAVPHTRRAPA